MARAHKLNERCAVLLFLHSLADPQYPNRDHTIMFQQLSKSRLIVLPSARSRHCALWRSTHSSARRLFASKSSNIKHTTDTYAKDDVDLTPPSDGSVFRVDSTSEAAQKPHEAPSGPWSRAGVDTEEYTHSDSAYKVEGGPGLRYGGKRDLNSEKGPETSGSDEGPERGSRSGRR